MHRIQTDSQEEWLPLEDSLMIVEIEFMDRDDVFDPLYSNRQLERVFSLPMYVRFFAPLSLTSSSLHFLSNNIFCGSAGALSH